jgi:tRNA (cytidine32/guanosine34-2'-O)-methyltransferase
LQLDEHFQIFKDVHRVVDLCAAPGSWSQVCSQKLHSSKRFKGEVEATNDKEDEETQIIAVDLQLMAPLPGVTQLQGDITRISTAHSILELCSGRFVDLVLCDGAPDVTGLHDLDEYVQSHLLLAALHLALRVLKVGGCFIAKIFRGEHVEVLVGQLELFFEDVIIAKPRSSRNSSIEAFAVCRKKRVVKDEMMLDGLSAFLETLDFATDEGKSKGTEEMVRFVAIGDVYESPCADKTYALPEGYQWMDPIQAPTQPPYSEAVRNKRQTTG